MKKKAPNTYEKDKNRLYIVNFVTLIFLSIFINDNETIIKKILEIALTGSLKICSFVLSQ